MEKAKPAIAVLLTVLVVMAIASLVMTRQAESSDASQIGRYQIVAGCYDSTVGEGPPGKGDGVLPSPDYSQALCCCGVSASVDGVILARRSSPYR